MSAISGIGSRGVRPVAGHLWLWTWNPCWPLPTASAHCEFLGVTGMESGSLVRPPLSTIEYHTTLLLWRWKWSGWHKHSLASYCASLCRQRVGKEGQRQREPQQLTSCSSVLTAWQITLSGYTSLQWHTIWTHLTEADMVLRSVGVGRSSGCH